MKPTNSEIKIAVAKLSVLRFFPAESVARAAVMDLLSRMVEKKEHLDWLVVIMIDQVGEWHGPKELRGVLCTRYKPMDGIDVYCSIPGFTAADSEAKSAQKYAPDRLMLAEKKLKLLPLPPEDVAANAELLDKVAHTNLSRISEPSNADRIASRRLLGELADIKVGRPRE